MLNSAKIKPALERKCVISEKIRWGPGSPGPSPGSTTGLVTRPVNGSEDGGDLVLMQTLLLLFCKSSCLM